jgi:hypothetical protein
MCGAECGQVARGEPTTWLRASYLLAQLLGVADQRVGLRDPSLRLLVLFVQFVCGPLQLSRRAASNHRSSIREEGLGRLQSGVSSLAHL